MAMSVKGSQHPAWVDDFLDSPRYAAFGSVRESGAPFVVPLGFLWDGEALFLTIRNGRGGLYRLRRDPRICMAVSNREAPPTWVVLEGIVDEVGDDEYAISTSIMERYKSRVVGLDVDAFRTTWLNTGRTLFRMTIERGTGAQDEWPGGEAVTWDNRTAGRER
jgi:nitroimidazol reductase NimA-like FMN-containing flavoprotein (pyridoxamine 5'-phosphate oxidase superfamily)